MKKVLILTTVLTTILLCNLNAQTSLTTDVYSSYFGGSGDEENIYLAVDNAGCVIIAGHSYSTNLPVIPSTLSNHNKVRADNPDGFITKFNPEMTEIIFSTYLGGSNYDEIKAVTVDDNGNIYVTGATNSNNFPVSPNALDKTFNGGFDIFITKLAPDGTIKYSTYLGGSGDEFPSCISMNDTSKIYLTGSTTSINFPKQNSLYEYMGVNDGFLTILNIQSNEIVFSSYIGGSGDDYPSDLKIDTNGNSYVSGTTLSANFPTKGAFMPNYGGREDGFIFKISKSGTLVFSSYLGGSGDEGIHTIDINKNGEVYFAGGSSNSTFTCSKNAFSTAIGEIDVIIGKISVSGDSLLYFSYFGGAYYDFARKIKHIGDDKIVIVGGTNSSNFPITSGAIQKTGRNWDVFLSVLDIAQKINLYSTYFGGSQAEYVFDLCVTNDSTFYFSGISSSTNLPVSSNAYTKTFQGVSDAVMAKFMLKTFLPTSINTGTKSNKINVYPNPTNGIVNLQFVNDLAAKSFVEIYNLQGSRLFSSTFQNTSSSTFNLSNYPKGTYILKLIRDGEIYKEKICLE